MAENGPPFHGSRCQASNDPYDTSGKGDERYEVELPWHNYTLGNSPPVRASESIKNWLTTKGTPGEDNIRLVIGGTPAVQMAVFHGAD
jgi:hypothetical protein